MSGNLIAPRREAIIESNGAGTSRLQEWMEAVTRVLNELCETVEEGETGGSSPWASIASIQSKIKGLEDQIGSQSMQGELSAIDKRLCNIEKDV